MEEIINMLSNYGLGIVCVGYMIYFQNTTMKEMLHTLGTINERLSIIEEKLEKTNKKAKKE
jgi:hypothetical protein